MIVKIEINANIKNVWDEITDIQSHPQWMIDAKEVKPIDQIDQHPFMVGNKYLCITKIGPITNDDYLTITNIKEPNLLAASHDGIVKGEGSFVLVKINDKKTELVWSENLKFPLKFGGRLGKLLAYPIFKVIWKIDLFMLKKRVESKTK